MLSVNQKFTIISGGQTGVDRAALDIALEYNIPCGGWCPKGRKAEDGSIDAKYPVQETNSGAYEIRTELNVKDTDGTLILTWGPPGGGTLLTIKFVQKYQKPHLVINMEEKPQPELVINWIKQENIKNLNIAGPRQSFGYFVYKEAFAFLKEIVHAL